MDRRKFCRYSLLTAAAVILKPGRILGATRQSGPRLSGNCRIEVVRCQCFDELQCRYLNDPEAGPCPRFKVGDIIDITPENISTFAHSSHFCPQAWRALEPYVMAALSQSETEECAPALSDNEAIISCPDGTRPVIFKVTAG